MLSPSDAPFENIIFHFSSLLTTTLIASHSTNYNSNPNLNINSNINSNGNSSESVNIRG